MTTAQVGVRLLRLRNARGISLRQLENMSQINKSTLHKWETDKAMPSREGVTKLASIYNVKPSWLLFGREETENSHQKMLDEFACLDQETQQVIQSVIGNALRLQQKGQVKNGT
ncbi:MAG: helix-turn-helix domain-containing protein [Luminiphilus sp.]|nr:helix-turn-helix domain-containing protein [Luminiphilus sp.]